MSASIELPRSRGHPLVGIREKVYNMASVLWVKPEKIVAVLEPLSPEDQLVVLAGTNSLRDNYCRLTPLHVAVWRGSEKAVRVLTSDLIAVNSIGNNLAVQLNARGQTIKELCPIHFAAGCLPDKIIRDADCVRARIVRHLASCGADLNAQTRDRGLFTALHKARHQGLRKVHEALVECGADTEVLNAYGEDGSWGSAGETRAP